MYQGFGLSKQVGFRLLTDTINESAEMTGLHLIEDAGENAVQFVGYS